MPALIPVIVVSLPRSLDRRSSIQARLDALGVPFVFHDAIDAQQLDDAAASRLCPGRARLSLRHPIAKGEIACAASHLAALRAFVESGERFACILEDDVEPVREFPSFLDPQWLDALPAFDMLKLGGEGSKRQDLLAVKIGSRCGRTLCVPLSPAFGAYAYIVTQEAARRVLRVTPVVQAPIDVTLFRRPLLTARILEIRPNAVQELGGPSLITPSRLQSRQISAWSKALRWLPHRLALWPNKMRRYVVFIRFMGVAGFRRLEPFELYDKPSQFGRATPSDASRRADLAP